MTSPIFNLPSVTSLVVRENVLQPVTKDWFAHRLNWINTVNINDVKSIDYTCEYCPPTTIRKLGTATKLETLRFRWYNGDIVGMDGCVRRLHTTQATLRELTIVSDTSYGRPMQRWARVDFNAFKALKRLQIPALALFERVSCSTLLRDPTAAGVERRDDSVRFLPPNLQELELSFQYPSGVFATSGRHMRDFQGLSEHEQLQSFDWILALLQLQSLRRVRIVETLCAHLWVNMRGAGDWPTSKYTPPAMVSEAFLVAGTELEIQLLETRDEGLRCEFESHAGVDGHWV
jgi:hypothetical protein